MVELRPILPGDPSYDWQGNLRNLSAEHAEGIGAYDQGNLVGSLTWRALGNAVHLVAAFVEPAYRSQGLFKRLFQYVSALHPDMPIQGDSEEGNPVKGLYDLHNYHLQRGLTLARNRDILWSEKGDFYGEDLEQKEGSEGRQAVGWRESQAQGYVTAGNEGEEYAWPSFDDIHEISLGAVENHQGYRDPGLVEGAVGNTQMMQQYGQHNDIFDTAAHLIAKIQRQQAIVEGNKRTATNVGIAFLANNGYDTSGLTDSEEKEDRLIWLVYNISDAVNAGGDAIIDELAAFLRENCKPEAHTAGIFKDDGLGTAFWFDPQSGLHWGDTHYMIFHGLFGSPTEEDYSSRHQGVYGWVYPDPYDTEHADEPNYDINFGTDFGAHANFNANPQLERDAVEEIEGQLGYPATDVYSNWSDRYHERNAGHAYESEDLDTARADTLTTPGAETHCQNCGSQINQGEICGDCGSENLMWWTEGEGLAPFKGSWLEDEDFNLLDKPLPIVYNTKTSDWDDQFEEPVDEDLGNFEQETNHLSEAEKQECGIEGPFEVDGWTVYTRDCGDVYPTHDAIWIDRGNKVALIGWQGHHHDLFQGSNFFQNLVQSASPYNQTAGHFRTEPSQDEPFPAGWGWHGSEGNKEEKNVLKQVIKKHYNVNKLKDLYQPNENAENDYFEGGDEPDEGYA